VLLAFIFCGVMFGLMIASNEASKESHVQVDGVQVNLADKPIQTKPLESVLSFPDLLKLKPEDLSQISFLLFDSWKARGTDETGNAKEYTPEEEGVSKAKYGTFSQRVLVDSFQKSRDGHRLDFQKGHIHIPIKLVRPKQPHSKV